MGVLKLSTNILNYSSTVVLIGSKGVLTRSKPTNLYN